MLSPIGLLSDLQRAFVSDTFEIFEKLSRLCLADRYLQILFAMLDELADRFSQKKKYRTRLSADKINEQVQKLLTETGLFGESRYQGFADNGGFSLRDKFVTKTKVPPLVTGRIIETENGAEVTIRYKPTDGLLLRFLLSIPILLIIIFLVPNNSDSGPISVLLKIGYALLFCGLWNLIIFLNARDSFKRSRQLIEGTLQLQE